MASDQVRIRGAYSPNPNRQEYYTLFCHSDAVRITVTARPAVVRNWIYAVRHRHRFRLRNGRLVVGLGVQWDHQVRHVASTLQLCVGTRCLVFQLEHADQSPAALRRFLSDTVITFVGFWNYRDAALLADSDHHRLEVRRLLDVRHVASESRPGVPVNASMERLAAVILGMPGMVKEEWVGMSDWNVR